MCAAVSMPRLRFLSFLGMCTCLQSCAVFFLFQSYVLLMNTYSSTHFFFTICFGMDDANFTYHPSLIIILLLINSFSYFIFSHQHIFPPLWMVDAMFIFILFFYLVLFLFSLASIQLFHPTHGLFCFILSSCTRNMAHNVVNTRSQSLLHRKYTCTRPVRQMPFGVTTLKIEVSMAC